MNVFGGPHVHIATYRSEQTMVPMGGEVRGCICRYGVLMRERVGR